MLTRFIAVALFACLPAQAADLVSRPAAVGHRDFQNAKKVLPRVYAGLEETFYCGCKYSGKNIDHASCGYRVRKNAQRAAKLEWEHVVPAWNIGHQRQCWQQGGRKQCNKHDAVFQKAEGDLVNLVPAIGEVNGDRSNFGFNVWSNDPVPMYGSCQTVVDFKRRAVQPRQEIRGRVARIQMYMSDEYGLRLSGQEQRLFCAWARTYPVDGWEKQRDLRITRIQGSGNRFVSDGDAVARFCQSQS